MNYFWRCRSICSGRLVISNNRDFEFQVTKDFVKPESPKQEGDTIKKHGCHQSDFRHVAISPEKHKDTQRITLSPNLAPLFICWFCLWVLRKIFSNKSCQLSEKKISVMFQRCWRLWSQIPWKIKRGARSKTLRNTAKTIFTKQPRFHMISPTSLCISRWRAL